MLAEKDVPVNVYYTVESDGFQIPVRETRPKNFDENKKYAVLFDVWVSFRDIVFLEFCYFLTLLFLMQV